MKILMLLFLCVVFICGLYGLSDAASISAGTATGTTGKYIYFFLFFTNHWSTSIFSHTATLFPNICFNEIIRYFIVLPHFSSTLYYSFDILIKQVNIENKKKMERKKKRWTEWNLSLARVLFRKVRYPNNRKI